MTIITKHNLDDLVWVIHNGKPKKMPIYHIEVSVFRNSNPEGNIYYQFGYGDNAVRVLEDDVHKTKEELLKYLSMWE